MPLPAKANLRLRWARGADRDAGYVRVPNPLRVAAPSQPSADQPFANRQPAGQQPAVRESAGQQLAGLANLRQHDLELVRQ